MEIGIKNTKEIKVSEENTAKTIGSGTLDVYATPMMVALIENTCMTSVENELESDSTTVGSSIHVSHLSPSPIGSTIRCVSTLVHINDRKLTFNVDVFDEHGVIGKGIHERFIVNTQKFLEKANKKL